MERKTKKQNKSTRLYIYALAIFAAYILFISQLNLSAAKLSIRAMTGGASSSSSGLVSLRAGASESEIVAAILPNEQDFTRPYSWKGNPVTLSASSPGNGYDMLADMERSISPDSLSPEQRARYESLIKNVYHPCCNAPVGGCGCKHAVATRGLIKKLLQEDWTDEQIMNEVFLWQRFWWPKHYATMATYLVSQGADPSEVPISEWVGSKMSTARAGRAAASQLGV